MTNLPNYGAETFLSDLNCALAEFDEQLEQSVQESVQVGEDHPILFIIGLPRSGTTLLSQVLAAALDVASTNNLIARFWDAPLVGCYLSKILLGDSRPKYFDSQDGIGKELTSPHEFSRFWHNLIGIDSGDPESCDVIRAAQTIDWGRIRRRFSSMVRILEKPIVCKPLELVGYHLRDFAKALPNSIYIYIEREPLDVALSLAAGRLRRKGTLEAWWSSRPLEYDRLKGHPYWHQIAGQIHYLREMYQSGLEELDETRVLRVTYRDLCVQPIVVAERVATAVERYANCRIQVDCNALPQSFEMRRSGMDPNVEQALRTGLHEFGL